MAQRTTTAQDERRISLLPSLAEVFARTGYRGTTTASLAEATGLQETQLYRVWPSKKAMFLAVIDYLYDKQEAKWAERFAGGASEKTLQRVLLEEGRERGTTGLHRILFAGLSETDDPEVREALSRMYRDYHRAVSRIVREHRQLTGRDTTGVSQAAWGLIAIGTFISIGRELDVFSIRTQRDLMSRLGEQLAQGLAGSDV
jgi:AcrR family transcriptional regulator